MTRLAGLVVVAVLVLAGACSGQQVVSSQYFADNPFPEYIPLWHEGWGFKDANGDPLVYAKPDMPLGGYVFVHFRNSGKKTIKVTDLLIGGIPMSKALAKTQDSAGSLEGHSILVSDLPKDRIEALKAAGHPMWWKAEPVDVQPGEIAQVVIRMRRAPKTTMISAGIQTTGGLIKAAVPVKKIQPRFSGICFSPDLRTAWLYPRHPKPGVAPESVLMDGRDVTARCKIMADRSLSIAPVAVSFSEPLALMSYHCFQVIYPDKSAATAGIHAWGSDIVYGMWGGKGEAKTFYTELAGHNINAHMGHAGKDVMEMSLSSDGLEFLTRLGIRNMATWHGNARNTLFYFLQDEPDAQDPGIDDLPPDQRLGLVGQYLVEKMNLLRAKDAKTPILLNIDNTYKPENWYMYHQLSDIPCLDPYYQGELDYTYWHHPGAMGYHYKPTYVYAATRISQSSAAPKPLHVILCSTKYKDNSGHEGRFSTPEEMRIQVSYALAAGAKGLSYWWFTPGEECNGCGADEPGAKALWKGIGILGAEVRTAGPIITASCPVSLPVQASRWLWVRTLISGTDTLAVIVVNDNVLCDRLGTVYKPVEKAWVTVKKPEWMKPKYCFEINSNGVLDCDWKATGDKLRIDLGSVEVSRFVVATSDASLKPKLAKLYAEKFAANIATLSTDNP